MIGKVQRFPKFLEVQCDTTFYILIRFQNQKYPPELTTQGIPSVVTHRSSTTVPSVATSVATTVFRCPPMGLLVGHRWTIGGHRTALNERSPKVGYPS